MPQPAKTEDRVTGKGRLKNNPKLTGKRLVDMTDEELIEEICEYLCVVYEENNPGTYAGRGTSLWSAWHTAALMNASVLRGIEHALKGAGQHALEVRRALAQNDPIAPVTQEERDAIERGAMTPARTSNG